MIEPPHATPVLVKRSATHLPKRLELSLREGEGREFKWGRTLHSMPVRGERRVWRALAEGLGVPKRLKHAIGVDDPVGDAPRHRAAAAAAAAVAAAGRQIRQGELARLPRDSGERERNERQSGSTGQRKLPR